MGHAVIAPAFAERLKEVLGTWGKPPDDVAKVAAALALCMLLLALFARGRSLLGFGPTPMPPKLFLWITAFTAALLSILYVAIYLRGGPRIIDATTYFLQGRALSHGDFSWPVADPSGSFRGRFLLFREASGGGVMGGIFPPGYPMLLSLGFVIGAPMVVGPAIAAAIVVVTYRLARAIAEDMFIGRNTRVPPATRELVEQIARTAALLSIFCGALRYHTADTMAHGATALGVGLALEAALKQRAIVAGLVVGAVVATRPVSAAPIAMVAMWLLLRESRDSATPSPGPKKPLRRVLVRFAVALVPGVLFLLLSQRSVTGAWLSSPQRMYYALSDGPPDCFRWGFGRAGCVHEHGEFVNARLANGFGVVAAAGTTLRRLRMHLLDIGNFEPLALLVLVPLVRARNAAKRSPAAVAAVALIGLHMLAYLPFYFDGNYPGGGARLFADLLPVEHALIAIAVAKLASVARFPRAAFALLAVSLTGFAVHAAFDHIKLADRDGGRPMFEPDVLARANITSGLIFIETDHGFALGYDPDARIKNGLVFARIKNDDRDRLLYDRLDHPPTWVYRFDTPPAPPGSPPGTRLPSVAVAVPWAPPALGETLRFEGESEWPVAAQSGGFALPIFAEACASNARALQLTPSPLAGVARATLSMPISQAGRYTVAIRVVQGTKLPFATTRGSTVPKGTLSIGADKWQWVDVLGGACADLPVREVALSPPSVTFVLEAEGGAVALDRVTFKRLP